jgi:probable F420-dependent oxidoreductase
MRIGFALPQVGQFASADAVARVAERAEALGYDSLWVLDRLLWPLAPQVPYPVTSDGSLPVEYQRVLDPLDTLTFAAARTKRIAVGTSVLNLPWYNPTLLARRLATLDVLSSGRLRVGLGIGWSPDEYEATGAKFKARGRTADEYVRALKAIWTQDPVEFEGTGYRIPKSKIALKPVQKPHPPIYMAAYTPAAMKRTAREANGWFPVGIPLAAVGTMFDQVKAMAREAGRDPASLELLVRANCTFAATPLTSGRADFTGTLEQIAEDIAATRKLGANELLFDVQFSPNVGSVDAMLRKLEELRGAAS